MSSTTFFTDYGGMQTEYGNAAKYSAGFIDQMNCLYLLSYLVTADREIAEWCLTRALDEYVEGRSEFLVWADREGRRAVLREAIRAIRPVPKQEYWSTYEESAIAAVPTMRQPFAAITSLSAFERFVFVMCTIENLPEEDSAALLNCSVQDVAVSRELARRIIDMSEVDVTAGGDFFVVPMLLGNQVCGVC
jgi:hypothetical protein